ncbi:glycoside hydrolase family 19 protein [Yersinia mollaretii]|uniref:glycoside hydrolase family 19 protein n=1 Tax=Yersinia mollaretii TaxID=33060 RepID=UPI001C968ED7|nr:hypothetical protein [Yersinia mollaretii]MDN0110118.1 hypothetical protein [Yersinia mollaretii]
MPAKLPKFSYPVPSNKNGQVFSTAEELLSKLDGESSGKYLVGSQGMWHGGIHITDATIPWCALSTNSDVEQQYRSEPYKGEQFIRCMADGEIVAWRVCKDYESTAIPWRDESLHFSTSFVLVKHYVQPSDTDDSGLTFYTLYMNLAPFSAYTPQGRGLDKKTAGSQRYYVSTDDVQAGRAAGTLVKNTWVTLNDSIITRSSDRRQFTEVTIAEEIKNAAGTTLGAGTKVWTVSDQGSLKASSSVSTPSWWAKCTLVYDTQPAGRVNCTSRTDWAYYLSSDDVLARKSTGKLAAGFPLAYEPDNTAQQVIRPAVQATDTSHTFSLVTLGRDVGKQKKGDRVWVVSDGDSLTPVTPTTAASPLVLGDVVKPPAAIPISAGDSIGHMGFFQLPEENGKRSRYQVHIECFSMDDKLPAFLTNPEHVGEQNPAFLKYPEAAVLFTKDTQGQMVDSTRKTRTQGIVTLSKVPVVEINGQPAYYHIHKENGYLVANSVQKLSQYALSELGFVTLDKVPESFDLLDGIKHPDNVVKGILEQMYKAAQDETRTSHALNEYNYKRLLELIDSNHDKHYSEQEYLQAVHNVSYRDHLYRIIAKHASEWYYGKDDPLWKTYLDTLTTDAPLWRAYTEAFIEKVKWMKQVTGMGPEPWHMHPVVFLEAMKDGLEDIITLEMIVAANLGLDTSQCQIVLPYVNKYAHSYNMTDKKEIAHFLSQIGHESGFKIVEEDLGRYSAKRMREIFGCKGGKDNYKHLTDSCSLGQLRAKLWTQESDYAGNASNLGSYVYASRMGNGDEASGDGYTYRGRGMIQLTGKSAYQGFTLTHNKMNPNDHKDFVANPDLIITDIEYGVESAFAFWIKKTNRSGEHLKELAKSSTVSVVTQIVNGGQNGYADRLKRYNKVAPLLGLNSELE